MLIYPAIDIIDGKAVRLFKGDFAQKTVYSDSPVSVAQKFKESGATHIHIVDLDGAKGGMTPNLETVLAIKAQTALFCEVGGGIRSMEVIDRYLTAGIDRVILGTAAVTEPGFVKQAVQKYGAKIAVGIDSKDGYVAIKGWTEKSALKTIDFCEQMQQIGVKTVICTDIARDGTMQGTNHDLYAELQQKFDIDFIASGGVSSIEDVQKLRAENLYGAIIGKAYYTGAVDLGEAIEVAK